jgi:hypothetical protein
MKKIIISIIVSVFVAGCAPTIKATKKLSSQLVGTVAVLPFNGHHGDQFADSVTQELMLHGVNVVERSRVQSVLVEQGLSLAQIASGGVNYEKIGGLLGVDTIVVGSVSPIVVHISGVPSGKISTAALRFVSVKNSVILGAATYDADTEFLLGTELYPKVAETLVQKLFDKR